MDQPDVVATLRGDLTDWRQWMARGIVLAYAAAAGLAVVAFTWLSDHALHGFVGALRLARMGASRLDAGLDRRLAWLTRRYYPGATGSGIPQVMAALSPSAVARSGQARLAAADASQRPS